VSDPLLAVVALDHVGIASDSGEPELTRLVGGPPTDMREMPSGVGVGRFGPGEQLELVMALRPGSPIERFLERRGPGLHHLALRVDEPLTTLLPRLEAAGAEPIGAIAPSSDGRPSLFLHPASTGGVLVELVEGPRP
jgi:catechol 2,3-dioxygenase-like lactoylglutathione lyase family enzyme